LMVDPRHAIPVMPREGALCRDEIDAAAEKAGDRLESDPDDADALFVLAASRAVSGMFAEAARLLNRLVRLRADYPGVWMLKNKVHEALGEPLVAAACRRAAILQSDT